MEKKYVIGTPIKFKVGMYDICKEPHFNFQLNRVINWNGGDLEEVRKSCGQMETTKDWKRILIELGQKAESEGRIENAIGYYRMSEFYMQFDDPDSMKYYHKARNLFYDYYSPLFSAENGKDNKPIIERDEVTFEDKIKLPIFHTKPEGTSKGVILVHGGLDSYMEEFLFPLLYLREKGFEVFLFEGPGQGSVLRLQNQPFIYEWEKPVMAITEHYNLNNVTIIGISLGGYFAPRAAAFDKRISHVVGWSVFPNVWEAGDMNKASVFIIHLISTLKLGFLFDLAVEKLAKKGNNSANAMRILFHRFGNKNTNNLIKHISNYDLVPIADKITQDVLILGADQDILIDKNAIGAEIKMLSNAKSLTYRLLTAKENAGDHCNCGNTKLALDTIIQWKEGLDQREI